MGVNASVPVPPAPASGNRRLWVNYLIDCIKKAKYELAIENAKKNTVKDVSSFHQIPQAPGTIPAAITTGVNSAYSSADRTDSHRAARRIEELLLELEEYEVGLRRIKKFFEIKGREFIIDHYMAKLIVEGKTDIDEVDDIY